LLHQNRSDPLKRNREYLNKKFKKEVEGKIMIGDIFSFSFDKLAKFLKEERYF
jgi:hypothetical protein